MRFARERTQNSAFRMQTRLITIAQVHGYAVGGGLVLMAACDLRVAAEDTVFSIPEIELGDGT